MNLKKEIENPFRLTMNFQLNPKHNLQLSSRNRTKLLLLGNEAISQLVTGHVPLKNVPAPNYSETKLLHFFSS